MKRNLLLVLLTCISMLQVFAGDAFTMYGYCTQAGQSMPEQLYGAEILTLSDDDMILFKSSSWEYSHELASNVSVYTNPMTENMALVIDSSDPTSDGILFATLIVSTQFGDISYVYSDTQLQFSPNYYYTMNGMVSTSPNNYGGSSSSAPANGGGNASNYQAMYDRWERNAQNAYNSLNGRSGSSNTYVRNKQILREAQREMRSIRQKAARQGITIRQSQWENVTVNVR